MIQINRKINSYFQYELKTNDIWSVLEEYSVRIRVENTLILVITSFNNYGLRK